MFNHVGYFNFVNNFHSFHNINLMLGVSEGFENSYLLNLSVFGVSLIIKVSPCFSILNFI